MMHRATGGHIAPDQHLAQSVADILTTPIGSRVMRRDYGSLVPALLDQPHNRALAGRIAAAAASALMRWEPRITVTRVWLDRGQAQGRGLLNIDASLRTQAIARPIVLQVVL